MLKFKVALIAILVGCVAFISCDRTQSALKPVADDMLAGDDMMTDDDMMMDMMKMLDSTMYMSWAHVALPAPTVSVADATSPAETGAAHNPPPIDGGALTARTVYINDIGAMANKAGAAEYPAGTIIVKEIMDKTETFVDKVAVMMKSDDMMYAGHNGWVYKKYLRPSADAAYMQIAGSNLEDAANGCHGCHAQADNDSVFVSLPMDDMMDDTTMDDDSMDDMDDTMMEDDSMDAPNGDVNGDGVVNNLDLAAVLDQIGQPVTADNMNADVDGDGVISQVDLAAVVASQFGQPVTADNMDFDLNGDGVINTIDAVAAARSSTDGTDDGMIQGNMDDDAPPPVDDAPPPVVEPPVEPPADGAGDAQ